MSVGEEQNTTLVSLNASGSLSQECYQRVKYEGEVCSKELAQWQLCFFGPQNTSEIYLPSLSDHQETEANASQLINFFASVLDPSSECVSAFRSFLCLYLFGSCDANSRFHQVTRADCVRLTTDLCKREFNNLARSFLREAVLPSCNSFQDDEIQCLGKYYITIELVEPQFVHHFLANVSSSLSDQQTFDVQPSNVTCADGFYLSNSSVCLPLCSSSWVELSEDNPFKWIVITTLVISLLVLVFVIIGVLTFRRSEMYVSY